MENCSEMFCGLTTNQTREIAYQTAAFNKLRYPKSWDRDKKAGIDWFLGFMNRRPNLSLGRPEALSKRRQLSTKHTWIMFNPKVDNLFVHPDVEDIQEIPFTMVRSRLNRKLGPSANTTSRTKNVFSFFQRLNDLNIN